jgi:TonB family protein
MQAEAAPPKHGLLVILSVAAAAVIAPALVYTAMHPASVANTVKKIAKHVPANVKHLKIAIVAPRVVAVASVSPSPTATAPSPSPTPQPSVTKAPSATQAAHLARAHALAVSAAAHKKRVASAARSANAGSPVLAAASDVSQAPNSSSSHPAAATPAPVATATATPVQVALAGLQKPVADSAPVYAPEMVVDAKFTRQIQPDYPEIAKVQNAQGTAVVLATIGPKGNVLAARVDQSTGNRLLDSAALAAARASGFEPPKINGKPATETYRLVYTFAL